MDIILDKIILLGTLMLIGFVAEKTGFVKGLKSASASLLTRITLPLLVITTLSGQAKSAQTQNTAIAVFILGVIFVGILLLLGRISAFPFGFSKSRKDVHVCLTAFGNTIFLGYPILGALWGEQAVFYAAFLSIANDLTAWTVGMLILSRSKGGTPDFKKLLNPTTLSYLIGALMFIFSLRLPPFLHEAASTVGSTTTVLSMLFLGATVADTNLKEFFSGLSSVSIVIIKMILVPILAFYVIGWLIPALDLPVDTLLTYVVALELAMPCQSVFAVLAQECGSDTKYAATAICLTTAASLITLPIVYSFMI